MVATVDKDAIASSAWTVVLSGVTGALVQLRSDGPVIIQVAASLPSASDTKGVVLVKDGLAEIALNGLDSGTDIVYARSAVEGQTERVCAIG